jgi:hypothetical protein
MPYFASLNFLAGTFMGVLGFVALAPTAEPDDGLSKKMLPIYVKEVEAYSIAVESAPSKELELKKEPIFEWANPARKDQQGVIFLWLRDGRPAALGCTFSVPHEKYPGRILFHELHALDTEKLLVKRDTYNQWKPEVGLARKELTDAPAPAATPAGRQLQMRKLAQEFSGHEIDNEGKKWEMRLLPTPLYKYPTAKTGVIDGALFALVSNAGTDPEVLLLIEARDVGGKLSWEYACGRFSDWELHVQRQDKEVFASLKGEDNPFAHDPQHLYRIYPEIIVTTEGKLLARVRQTPRGRVIIPVEDK